VPQRWDEDPDREQLTADLKTALLSGGGLGLSLLGVLFIPIAAMAGIVVSYLGWRSARQDYRVGKWFAVAGMMLGFFGTAALVTRSLA
jgi:hypothetical protein